MDPLDGPRPAAVDRGTAAGGRRWSVRSARRAGFDLVLALGLMAFGLVATRFAGENQPGSTPLDTLGVALIVAATAALVVRRRWPLVTLGVDAVAVSTYLVLGYPYGPVLIAYVVAVYTVATRLPTRRAAVAGVVATVVLSAHVVAGMDAPGWFGLLPASAWTVVPFALGVTVRLNREAVERNRAELARRHADEERLRIAQEVHDVVGHGLSAINMQAEIALHLLPKRPEQAESALEAISRTSREALDELRVTLAVVRRGADRQPAPGLGQLDQLRDRLAGAGLSVSVAVTGRPRDLPAAVDLAGYRVVQESLTNVLRHAGPATAAVRIGYGDREVTVEVTDQARRSPTDQARRSPADRSGSPVTGPPAVRAAAPAHSARTPTGAGHGLAGMRERVTALGGEFAAGPRPEGGFRVYARIPAEPRS
ncbi:sensor histidine kinase [Plantactinospora sp. GCM10030261]|uniref:sensor histidine kinase n=1 Tax=Plantactinospora sp. GCM10030261 TaxID=3273420 RepID=UPI003621718D